MRSISVVSVCLDMNARVVRGGARHATLLFSLSPGLESPPQLVDDVGGEVVEPLSDGVEHDEAEGNPDHGVDYGEHLPAHCLWSGVAVACRRREKT